jgi:hypothetical protein
VTTRKRKNSNPDDFSSCQTYEQTFYRITPVKRIAIWFLVALWMLEELLWDAINWIEKRIAFLHLVQIVERWIAARTPWQAAALMLTPVAVLFPAKIIGTAIVARMYRLCKEALLTLAWFAWGYRLVVRISTWVRSTDAWQTAMRWKNAIRANARDFMKLLAWHNR